MRTYKPRLLVAAGVCITLIICGGLSHQSDTEGLFTTIFFGPSNDLNIDIDNPAVPNTKLKAQPDFDIFAWNSFIALNWPAINPDSSNNYLRGIPDLNKSFATANPGDLLVWETFKEKRELFNQTTINGTDTVKTLFPWHYPVEYGDLRAATTDIDPNSPNTTSMGTRIFHQSKKQMAPFNSFDETAEVGSEILEDTLYGGIANPVLSRPAGPRVWRGNPTDSMPVLYEVKLNYDYYNYIKSNKLYLAPTAKTNNEADLAELRLPYRTSASMGPKSQVASSSGAYQLATSYSEKKTAAAYKKINATMDTVAPPLLGAMQFKVAWVKLDSTKDDISTYHTAQALYYDSDENGNPVAHEGLFGLIGMHIIQRIHISNNDGEALPTGGTFIFATWEHTSLRSDPNDVGYTYSNYYNPEVDPAPPINPSTGQPYPQGLYPPIDTTKPYDGVYPVPRVFDIISNDNPNAPGTAQVNQRVHSMLPDGSVWKNYQLVGTQFIAIDVHSASLAVEAGQQPRYPVTELDPQGIGLPVYLANLVIETNQGLQKFQGQPPGTIPINNYAGAGVDINDGNNFERDNTNTSFNRVAYNMGGCMGCHGVAQSKGFSFSFVLLGGRNGALTDTETHFEIPPLEPVDGNE